MKTPEQIKDELIEYYKIHTRELEGQLATAKNKLREMERSFRVSPSDQWYLQYLMKTNASLEREVDNRQQVIEQYQRHYQKFGKFYNEHESSRGLSDADILGNSDNVYRGAEGYPQGEEEKKGQYAKIIDADGRPK